MIICDWITKFFRKWHWHWSVRKDWVYYDSIWFLFNLSLILLKCCDQKWKIFWIQTCKYRQSSHLPLANKEWLFWSLILTKLSLTLDHWIVSMLINSLFHSSLPFWMVRTWAWEHDLICNECYLHESSKFFLDSIMLRL